MNIGELVQKLQSFPQDQPVECVTGVFVYGDLEYYGPRSGSSKQEDGDEIEKALKVIGDICRKHLDKPSPCLDCPLCYLYDYDGHCLFSQCWPEQYAKEYKKLLKEREED